MTRFVVFREFRGIMIWYVEATDEQAAMARVWPEEPSRDPTFVDHGDMVPRLEAYTGFGTTAWTRRVRRFPGSIAVASGSDEIRYIGAKGER